jgi:hypothetical protein
LVYVTPQTNAFSYVLRPAAKPAVALACPRAEVVPGEVVVVRGRERHEFRVPADAKPGVRLWQQFEDAWIDFTVVPLADAELSLSDKFQLDVTPHQAQAASAEVMLGEARQTIQLTPEQSALFTFDFKPPTREEVRELPLRIVAGDLRHEQKWWLLTEESTESVVPMPEKHETGQCVRNAAPSGLDGKSGASVHPDNHMASGNETKQGIFMHPPYKGGTGFAFALYEPVTLPPKPSAAFRCDIGKRDGSDRGDGVLFRVAVVDGGACSPNTLAVAPSSDRVWRTRSSTQNQASGDIETIVAEKQWAEHAWTPLEADLSRWAGRQVRLKLISDVGPADNSSGDWACWANPRIESREPVLKTTLHDRAAQLRHEPGPHPVANLAVGDLRAAKRGWLHFEGIGLQRGGGYISHGDLNGISIGELPSSRGNEATGVWTPAVSVALPPEAIAKLGKENVLKIKNPSGDCFKVRRFWIELELADGRKCSSKVHALAYTQPAGWLHAEGICVPADEDITVDIRFDMSKQAQE